VGTHECQWKSQPKNWTGGSAGCLRNYQIDEHGMISRKNGKETTTGKTYFGVAVGPGASVAVLRWWFSAAGRGKREKGKKESPSRPHSASS